MAIIQVNGKPQEIQGESITVAKLLVLNKVEMPETVSVQFNGDFLERQAFESTKIGDKDEVDFLYFLGGGAAR